MKIEIYTTQLCPYCVRAKSLLTQKNLSFKEIRVDLDETKKAEMLARAEGRKTVPQIFINGKGVGGYDDLYALEQSGKLDTLLRDL